MKGYRINTWCVQPAKYSYPYVTPEVCQIISVKSELIFIIGSVRFEAAILQTTFANAFFERIFMCIDWNLICAWGVQIIKFDISFPCIQQ